MTDNQETQGIQEPAARTAAGFDPATGNGTAADARLGDSAISETADEVLTSDAIEELRSKAAKADENWDKYVRLAADFDNFKKRAGRERTEAIKYANEALLEKLIPILDNFEAALVAVNSAAPDNKNDPVKMGVNMIFSQLKNVMSEAGLEEIDASQKPFDPNLHEALSQQESTDLPEGQVVQQLRKGYKLRDRLIRPAMVVVSKRP